MDVFRIGICHEPSVLEKGSFIMTTSNESLVLLFIVFSVICFLLHTFNINLIYLCFFLRNNTSREHKRNHDSILYKDTLTGSNSILCGEGSGEEEVTKEIEETWDKYEKDKLLTTEVTEAINIGTLEKPRELKIGTSLNLNKRTRMIELLKEY